MWYAVQISGQKTSYMKLQSWSNLAKFLIPHIPQQRQDCLWLFEISEPNEHNFTKIPYIYLCKDEQSLKEMWSGRVWTHTYYFLLTPIIINIIIEIKSGEFGNYPINIRIQSNLNSWAILMIICNLDANCYCQLNVDTWVSKILQKYLILTLNVPTKLSNIL